MKKILLIVLMLLLPWQAIAASERSLAHMLSGDSSKGQVLDAKHIAEHVSFVPHHHDDDDDDDDDDDGVHVDNSSKSFQHMADYDHGYGANVIFPAPAQVFVVEKQRVAPTSDHDVFANRTTIPPLPPPRKTA